MVFFNNCDVIVNGTGLMADTASVQTENSLAPIYILGKKGTIGQSPSGPIKSTFQFSYIPQLSNEPNYNTSNLVKNLLNDIYYTGITLEIAGIMGQNCFLENFSLRVQQNEVAKATASYTTFNPLFGNVKDKNHNIIYNTGNNIGHGWTTFILSTGNFMQIPTYQFSYDLNIKWEPIYTLGQKYPAQVKLMQGEEKIIVEKDIFYNISFSGDGVCDNLFNCSVDGEVISLNGLSMLCQNDFSFTGLFTGNGSGSNGTTGSFSGIILDNTVATYSGSWFVGTYSPEKFGNYYTFTASATGNGITATATYIPKINTSGYYNVYMIYTDGQSRSSNVPVSIGYSGGVYNTFINETTNGGQWNLIASGLKYGTGSNGYYAVVSNNTNQTGSIVIANAFLWITGQLSGSPSNILTGIIFTGQAGQNQSTLQSCASLDFSISGYKIKTAEVKIALDDIVRTETTIYRHF